MQVDDASGAESAARLEESEQRYRLLAENSADVVVLADAEYRVVYASPAVTELLGWAPDDLLGQNMLRLAHPDDLEATLQARGRLAQQGQVVNPVVLRLRKKDGGYRHVATTSRQIHGEDGSVQGVVGTLRDAEPEVAAAEALEAERDLLRATLDSMLDPHVVLAAVRDESGAITDFTYVDANAEALAYFGGMSREQLLGSTMSGIFPSEAAAGHIRMYARTVETGEPLALDDFVYPNELYDGAELRYDIRATKVGDGLALTWRDVTARHEAADRLSDSEELYRLLAENTTDVILQIALDGTILWASRSAYPVLGYHPDDLIGRPNVDLVHPDERGWFSAATRTAAAAGETTTFELRVLRGDGGTMWVESSAKTAEPGGGKAPFRVVRLRDIDPQVRLRTDLENRARTDALTGLLTRREGWRRLGQDLHERRRGQDVAVLFIDLDGFKHVNDERGHQVGDALLVALAARLQGAVRDDDYVVRVGGDELLVVLNDVDGQEAALDVAEKVRAAVALPVSVDGVPVSVTASVGVTLATADDSVTGIVHRADRAMYRAKATGKNQVVTID